MPKTHFKLLNVSKIIHFIKYNNCFILFCVIILRKDSIIEEQSVDLLHKVKVSLTEGTVNE